MIFGEVVSRIVGGEKRIKSIAVSAFDGLIIEEWRKEGIDLDLSAIAAEIAFLLKELSRISDENALSRIDELCFGGSDFYVHVLAVEKDYFLFVVTSEVALTGKTRFYLKSVVPALRDTL
jgi:predicted regulator of Ras-like GTPase activity (Roadblock/LC7/MglB family)